MGLALPEIVESKRHLPLGPAEGAKQNGRPAGIQPPLQLSSEATQGSVLCCSHRRLIGIPMPPGLCCLLGDSLNKQQL